MLNDEPLNEFENELQREAFDEHMADQPYDGGGWAGDGSGTDDFADMNANEADDYANEGAEDSYLDSAYEDQFDLGD